MSAFGLIISLGRIVLVGKDLLFIVANFVKSMGGLGGRLFESQASNIQRRVEKQKIRAADGGKFTKWVCEWSIKRDRHNSKKLQGQIDRFLIENGFYNGSILDDDGVASAAMVRGVMSKFGPYVDRMTDGSAPVDLSRVAFWLVVIGQVFQILQQFLLNAQIIWDL